MGFWRLPHHIPQQQLNATVLAIVGCLAQRRLPSALCCHLNPCYLYPCTAECAAIACCLLTAKVASADCLLLLFTPAEYGADHVLAHGDVRNAEECCTQCRRFEGCNIWLYCPSPGGCSGRPQHECWLKQRDAPPFMPVSADRGPGACVPACLPAKRQAAATQPPVPAALHRAVAVLASQNTCPLCSCCCLGCRCAVDQRYSI